MEVVAAGEASAVDEATCTGSWAQAEWCKPIWPATQKMELAALLTTLGWWESRFSERVHKGRCAPYECDATKLPNGVVIHRARSPWQIQWSPLVREDWPYMTNDSPLATFHAARAAVKVLASQRGGCGRYGDWVYGTISGYATGGRLCAWGGARNRTAFYRRLIAGSLRGDEPLAATDQSGGSPPIPSLRLAY